MPSSFRRLNFPWLKSFSASEMRYLTTPNVTTQLMKTNQCESEATISLLLASIYVCHNFLTFVCSVCFFLSWKHIRQWISMNGLQVKARDHQNGFIYYGSQSRAVSTKSLSWYWLGPRGVGTWHFGPYYWISAMIFTTLQTKMHIKHRWYINAKMQMYLN